MYADVVEKFLVNVNLFHFQFHFVMQTNLLSAIAGTSSVWNSFPVLKDIKIYPNIHIFSIVMNTYCQ